MRHWGMWGVKLLKEVGNSHVSRCICEIDLWPRVMDGAFITFGRMDEPVLRFLSMLYRGNSVAGNKPNGGRGRNLTDPQFPGCTGY